MGSTNQSFFQDVTYTPPDAIFELTKAFNADPSESKVNLGQGTYKDENGDPWILPAVQAAKRRVEGTNHEYLPILGLPTFRNLATELLFGKDSTLIMEKRVSALSTMNSAASHIRMSRWHHAKPYQEQARCILLERCFSRHSRPALLSTSQTLAGQIIDRCLNQ